MKKRNGIIAFAIMALLLLGNMVSAEKAVLKSDNPFNKAWQAQVSTQVPGNTTSNPYGAERVDANGNPRGKCVVENNRYTGLPMYGGWVRLSNGTYDCRYLRSFCQRFPSQC